MPNDCNSKKHIILTGFMGSGKTTLGLLLAQKYGRSFFDLDSELEAVLNCSIQEYFKLEGERMFRKVETQQLKKILTFPPAVIALGGGTPCYHENMELIKKHSKSIYLKLSSAKLFDRLVHCREKRPLISDCDEASLMKFIHDSLGKRKRYYEMSDLVFSNDETLSEATLERLHALLH